ncbi:MAG TPA: Hsp70 family protein [Actinomycetospora sp.]|nr:Hsp70 family protein [Actinomycetospora sp.]
MAYGLGVDLGTTFTAAAVVRDGHVEMASLGDRSTAMPSVVLMRADGGVLVGDAAVRRAAGEPDRVAREVKRRLGDPTPLLLGGTPYSATDLLAAQLREVVAQITEREGGPPTAVRLTHPANWGPYKRELFAQVPRLADLHDVAMITEPEAAAAHYAANERIGEGRTVAVYDLGGGTFDATVLHTAGGGFEILGEPEGVEGLGGVDFDEAVFAHVDRALDGAVSALDPADAAATSAIVRLRQDCVLAKEALSADTEATIPVLLPNLQTEVRLTRGEFEEMIRPSVTATIAALGRALESAQVAPDQLDTVLLVGGSSRIPLVSRMVSAELGRPTSVDAHPKHAIVLGAAMLVEPPARASGAVNAAHTAVFPSSGAPYRTPVPPAGPRTPAGGVPLGPASGPTPRPPSGPTTRPASGPRSGTIPAVATSRSPSGPPTTGATRWVNPGRTPTGGFPAATGAATWVHPGGRAPTPPSAPRSAGPATGATAWVNPGRGPATGATTTTPGAATAGGSATGATAAVVHGPPALGDGADTAPAGRRRRVPMVVAGVALVALLVGGGTLAYANLAADAPLAPAPAPAPTAVVAPTPLPTTTAAPAVDPGAGGAAGTGGGAGSGGSGAGSVGSGGGSGGGGTGGGGGRGDGNGSTTWRPSTTHDGGETPCCGETGGGGDGGGSTSGTTDGG